MELGIRFSDSSYTGMYLAIRRGVAYTIVRSSEVVGQCYVTDKDCSTNGACRCMTVTNPVHIPMPAIIIVRYELLCIAAIVEVYFSFDKHT